MRRSVANIFRLGLGSKALVAATAVVVAGTFAGYGLAAANNSNGSGNGSAQGAPPQPLIGVSNLPTNPTNATAAAFTYTDSRSQVNFFCSLDGAPFASCPASGISYSGLGNATHTFRVEAQSGGGNAPVSTPATLTWTVANQSFPISGSLTTPLAPGLPAQPLDLLVTNPFTFNMKLTAITVAVTGTSKSGCQTSNFSVTQYSGPNFIVTASTNQHLSQAAGVTSAQLPTVRMLNLDTNQDSCKGAMVSFNYSGTATTP